MSYAVRGFRCNILYDCNINNKMRSFVVPTMIVRNLKPFMRYFAIYLN